MFLKVDLAPDLASRYFSRFAKMGKFYAVYKGKNPGVYTSWPDCKKQVTNFKGCSYKSFLTEPEAQHFVKTGTSLSEDKTLKVIPDKADKIDTNTLLEIFGNESDDQFFDSDDDALPTKSKTEASTSAKKSSKKGSTPRKRTLLLTHAHSKKMKCDISTLAGQSSDHRSSNLSLKINDIEYNVDNQSRPIVYTDGACSNNGKKKGTVRAGYGVWWGDSHPLNLSCRLQGTQTNQRAEIAAVNACLEQAIENGIKSLTIRTDSMFIINCITKWVQGWVRKNWVKSDGKPVIHKNEFLVMLPRLKKVKVNWEHVRGHMGIHGNEMADRLAVKGATL